ncbi:hypothetical protein [Halococcus sediminicola]|uniref:hypothetical protein n=1 Tax=Halococcus sediminicola TaxID=1264579 RepID=UPI000A4BC4C4|nr:hypothetical protein [Halococcus sediminicola]
MVGPNETFLEIPCELELGEGDDPYTGRIILSEGGNLRIEFEEGVVHPFTDIYSSWASVEGVDKRGYDVHMERVRAGDIHDCSLLSINGDTVSLTQDPDHAPDKQIEVVVEFDVVCFQPEIPPRNEVDTETRNMFQQISNQNNSDVDIPKEIEIRYTESDERAIYGVPLTDTKERTEAIEEHRRPVRTGKIRVKQRIHGDLAHQVEMAKESVHKVLEISQLIQETAPRLIRAKIISMDGISVDDLDVHYELLKTGSTANVGGRFSSFPDHVLRGDFPEYVKQAYENYTPRVRDDLRVRQVLGYYIDARDPDRPVEGKMLSTCSAIELLALKHAQEDEVSTSTGPKIEHLVDKLDVETEDLASQVVPDVDELDTPAYFWSPGRNYVSHGDPHVSTGELIEMQEVTLVLLKRILRNQLLGSENDSFDRFYSMRARPRIKFGDDSDNG